MEARECRQSWQGRQLTSKLLIGNIGQRNFVSERLGCWSAGRRPDRCPSMKRPFQRTGYFCMDKDSTPREARLQPRRHPPRHVGKDREANVQRRTTERRTQNHEPSLTFHAEEWYIHSALPDSSIGRAHASGPRRLPIRRAQNDLRPQHISVLGRTREATTHHHKRACVLTARKLVRLIHTLLRKGQLYQTPDQRKEARAANPLPAGMTPGELARRVVRRRQAKGRMSHLDR